MPTISYQHKKIFFYTSDSTTQGAQWSVYTVPQLYILNVAQNRAGLGVLE